MENINYSDMMENLVGLSPLEANTWGIILQAANSLPRGDPRYVYVICCSWWLLHRRKRMEQTRIRRRRFYQRFRRMMLIRLQMQKQALALKVASSSANKSHRQPYKLPKHQDIENCVPLKVETTKVVKSEEIEIKSTSPPPSQQTLTKVEMPEETDVNSPPPPAFSPLPTPTDIMQTSD